MIEAELTETNIREAFSTVHFEVPLSRILDRARRRQLRHRVSVALPVMGLLTAGGAALLRADELIPNGVLCFDRPPNHEAAGQYPIGHSGPSPKELCARLWASKWIDRSTGEIPPLEMCAFDSGAVAVFPAEDGQTCSSVGLQEVPEGYMARVQRFVEMRDEVAAELKLAALAKSTPEKACLDAETSSEIVSRVLQAHGFDDWTVAVARGDERAVEAVAKGHVPCEHEVEFDSEQRRATIFSSEPGVDSIYVF